MCVQAWVGACECAPLSGRVNYLVMSSSQSNTRTGSYVCVCAEAKLGETRYQLDTSPPVVDGRVVELLFSLTTQRSLRVLPFRSKLCAVKSTSVIPAVLLRVYASYFWWTRGVWFFWCKEPSSSDCAQPYILPLSWNARTAYRLSCKLDFFFHPHHHTQADILRVSHP